MDERLVRALEASRQRKMTKDEIEAQMISFAFGNAAEEDDSTKDTVRAASTILKSTTTEK